MKTTNLRSLSYQLQPHMPLLIFVAVIALLFVVNGSPQQAHVDAVRPTAALPITPQVVYIIATALPTAIPTPAPVVVQMAAPTVPPPVVIERVVERVEVQTLVIVATPTEVPGPQLQALSVPEEEEPLTDAQMREAQDQ